MIFFISYCPCSIKEITDLISKCDPENFLEEIKSKLEEKIHNNNRGGLPGGF